MVPEPDGNACQAGKPDLREDSSMLELYCCPFPLLSEEGPLSPAAFAVILDPNPPGAASSAAGRD